MFSLEHLSAIRVAELERTLPHLGTGASILEVGAGTGQQARMLAGFGYTVQAIDIPQSNYAEDRIFPVADYDGRTIPFPDAAFDIVFSSNTLEHVPDLRRMHAEIGRVLRPDGYAVHVMPTHAWRFWSTLSSFPAGLQHAWDLRGTLVPRGRLDRTEWRRLAKAAYTILWYCGLGLLQRRHGERGTVISETWLFHPAWWRRNFRDHGFTIVHDEPLGIFHTGNMVAGSALPIRARARLAGILGSACHIFVVRPAARAGADRRQSEIRPD